MSQTMRATLSCAFLLLAGVEAGAQDTGGVIFHGFVGQGYLKSSANRYLAARTDEGTFALTEGALNVSAEPLPKLRVAAQLLARDLGVQGNNRVSLDWGLGDYRAKDWLGLRAGRLKLPIGLYNTLVDADVARPELLQPSGLYPLERRDITNAVDGGGVYGTVGLGGAGYLEYQSLVGTLDLDETYVLTRTVRETSTALLRPLSAARLTGLGFTVNEASGDARWISSTYAEWRPPVPGLRLRVNGLAMSLDASAFTTYTGYSGAAPVAIGARMSLHRDVQQLVLSTEYMRGGLRVTVEHLRQPRNETFLGLQGFPFPTPAGPPTVAEQESTYGQVAYRIDDHVQLSGYYAVSYSDRHDKSGQRFIAVGQPAHRAWVKDLAFTGRADVNRHWLFKVEYHHFDGTANLSGTENPNPLTQNWNLFAVKTTFHF
jgi:hypothetical protein